MREKDIIDGNLINNNYLERRAKLDTKREIIFGKGKHIRFYQISKKEDKNPELKDTWFIMTNKQGKIAATIATEYSLRN